MSTGPFPGHAETVLTDCVSDGSMNDLQREAHIKVCGERMINAYAAYEASGNPADRQEALRWQTDMTVALRSRSAKTVARMEREKDL